VPVSPSRLKVIDWLPLIEKGIKRLDIWKGGSLSIADRSTLFTPSLNNSPMYHVFLPKRGSLSIAALMKYWARLFADLRPCLVHPKTKNFSRFSITSNLVAYAWSIKCR